ncbi:MAG TPA: AsnC family transcriptional regulator [Thiobacillaceae bacterium]|nr:AsnC family transcriptional regulator [Thiobacillaceae bacterium]HNU64110.1 AsnC family transcriptional regulator [Thiobacillaceae bacterium]
MHPHSVPPPIADYASAALLDDVDRRIINGLQGGFPVCTRPYARAARDLGLEEAELLARLRRLLDERVLTRFGPLFDASRFGGANVLAAMSIPRQDFERIAQFVNQQPEIAHNYRREHRLNMWFVGAAETPEKVEAAFRYIEDITGYPVFRFPKEQEYFVELMLRA